jgi:bleomycin hydrolase
MVHELNIKELFEREDNKVLCNAFSNVASAHLVTNRSVLQSYNHEFSHVIKTEPTISDQKQSGKCWMISYMSIARTLFIDKYKLSTDFEFSQSYLFFWDKLERCNLFLNNICNTVNKSIDDPLVDSLMSTPIHDGGLWPVFINLVNKYGVVPNTLFRTSNTSDSSDDINRILCKKLRVCTKELRESNKNNHKTLVKRMQGEIFDILSVMMGRPPTEITWEYYEENDEHRKRHTIGPITPLNFYKTHVPFESSDYVCLWNLPHTNISSNKKMCRKDSKYMLNGEPDSIFNQPLDILIKASIKSLKDNVPVPFGNNIEEHVRHPECLLDPKIYDYESVFGKLYSGLSKKDLIKYSLTKQTHVMLLTGVDLVDGVGKRKRCETRKWKVANSWGIRGESKGYLTMTHDWFEKYVYHVVINKKYLTKTQLNLIENADTIMVDPFFMNKFI